MHPSEATAITTTEVQRMVNQKRRETIQMATPEVQSAMQRSQEFSHRGSESRSAANPEVQHLE
jgi:hypothetical protein